MRTDSKAESLDRRISAVYRAFHATGPGDNRWVAEVWDEYAIVQVEDHYYRTGYTYDAESNSVEFAPVTEWVEVTERREWVEAKNKYIAFIRGLPGNGRAKEQKYQPTHKLHPWGLWSVKEPTQLCKIEDVDTLSGVITGYFSAFNNVDSDGDFITPGAFARTIAEWGPKGAKRIRHLLDHNPTTRIGVIQELTEDNHGLRFVSKLFSSEHSHARNALIEYSEGGLTEHSIGFDVIGWRRDEDRGAFALTELKLYEGSAVAWGANPATPTIDVKGLSEDPFLIDQMGHQMSVAQRVLKRAITDDHAKLLKLRGFVTVGAAGFVVDGPAGFVLRSSGFETILIRPFRSHDVGSPTSNSSPILI